MGEKLPDEIKGATEVDVEDDINGVYWQRAIFSVKNLVLSLDVWSRCEALMYCALSQRGYVASGHWGCSLTSPGIPTPAAGIIPPKGAFVESTQLIVPFTAASMLSESVTSTWKNLARDSPPSCLTSSAPFSSFKSRMEMLPPCSASSRAVARPRPEAL